MGLASGAELTVCALHAFLRARAEGLGTLSVSNGIEGGTSLPYVGNNTLILKNQPI